MIIDIVCTFSATTIQAETKSVSLVLTFPATQLPSNICEEVQDCLGISPSGEADYFLNEQGDWVQVQGGAVDSVNGQTGVVVLDTDDIQDTANNRYTNDTDITRLANTSGTNTGDQDLSGLVPYTGATQNVNLGTYNLIADQVQLNVSPSGTLAVGATEWNDTVGVSQTLLKGGSVTLKNGVDLVARVVNKVSPNTTLTKAAYQVVKISGAQGQRLAVDLAQANNDNNSADTLGVVIETIAPNQEGFIMTVGQLEGINTTGSLQGETWADGNVLYLSPTVAGRITNVKPTGATGHIVIIGYVEYAHANNGKIYVKIMNGWELDELHNVYINTGTLANNDALIYESSTQLWKNKTIATALGFTPENVANKENTTLDSSTTKYPTNNLVKTYADAKVTDAIVDGVTTIAPSQNAVFDALALKQNSLGFTPENVANKQNSLATDGTGAKYATVDAINSALNLIPFDPSKVIYYDDFVGGVFNQTANFNSTNHTAFLSLATGARINTMIAPFSGATGVLQCETQTGATASGLVGGLDMGVRCASGVITYTVRWRAETLSDVTNRYDIYAGLGNRASYLATGTIAFVYSDNINSGKFQIYRRNSAGAISTDDSGITVNAGQWYILKIVVNAAGTSAEFFIDGVSVGAFGGLPNSTSSLGAIYGWRKSLGTANRNTYLDYQLAKQDLNFAR